MDAVEMNACMFGGAYQGKKVLITGNSGFKGSWLTLWLLRLGADVCGIAKDIPTTPSMFEALGLDRHIKHYVEDVRDLEPIEKIVNSEKPDFLFHLAAQPLVSASYSDPVGTIATNAIGTANILEALRKVEHRCCAIVITSDKCYENVEWPWGYKETDTLGGKDIYGGSKGAAELIFKAYNHSFFRKSAHPVRAATTRAGNVIGGGDWARDRIVPDCMRAWSLGDIVEIRRPDATRPWQHVLEPLSGYLVLGQELIENEAISGESFNFGPPAEYDVTVNQLIEDLCRRWKFDDPSKVYRIAADRTFHEAGLLKLNCDKALFHLKWVPTLSYSKLIEFTGDWYFRYYSNPANMLDYTLSQISEYEQIANERRVQWAHAISKASS